MLSSAFLNRIEHLNIPSMGTEMMGPLLYTLVRFTQPSRILEVGAGYTSLFLLKAIADNESDRRKHQRVADWLRSEMGESPDELKQRAEKEMPLRRLEYYAEEDVSQAKLVLIDSLQNLGSSAELVQKEATKLGFDDKLEQHACDFRDCASELRLQEPCFDLVWYDCGYYQDYKDFIDLYWDMVNPNGGLLLLHSTLTNVTCRAVLDEFKRRQSGPEFNDFEVLSLLEPHKYQQNSVTLIRRTSAFQPPDYTIEP